MGWMSWAKEKVWDNGLVGNFIETTGAYTYKSMAHVFEQIGVLPKVAYSLMTHESAKKISRQMVTITLHDLLPMIFVNAVNASIQQAYAGEDTFEDNPWVSSAYLLSSSLALIQLAVNAYNFRQGIQMTTRTMLVALSAPDAFNEINPRQKSPLCIEDKCTTVQRIKSGGQELVQLMANDLAVSALGQLPYMNSLSRIISIYVRGRYILISTTPERCPKHRAIESENAFALGLSHEGLMALLRHLLSSTVGLPPALCLNTMEKMLLVFQMAVAAHLSPPLVKSGNGTLSIDPLETYERMTGWITKVIAHGLTKEVPRLFKGPGADIPWNKIISCYYTVNNHPFTGRVKHLVLPPLLHSDKQFVQDPVIKELWQPLQKQLNTCLTVVLNAGNNKPVLFALATWAPETTSLALKLTFGIPQKLTKALVLVTGDDNVRYVLQKIQNWIQSLAPEVRLVVQTRPGVRISDPDKTPKIITVPVKKGNTATTPEMFGKAKKEGAIDPEELLARKKPSTAANIGFYKTKEKSSSPESGGANPGINELLSF